MMRLRTIRSASFRSADRERREEAGSGVAEMHDCSPILLRLLHCERLHLAGPEGLTRGALNLTDVRPQSSRIRRFFSDP